MRKLFFVAIILLLSVGFINAQTATPTKTQNAAKAATVKKQAPKLVVPAVVKAKIKELYPSVKEVKWEKENGNYEAEIEQKGSSDVSVVLDVKGTVLETETEIKVAELPEAARAYITKNIANAKIKEAAKIVKADNTVEYEAEIGKKDYIFDSNGQFLRVQ
jgi:hypothetical protein